MQREREQVSPVTMSSPSLRTVAPPPCLPMYVKDSLKKEGGIGRGLIDWLAGCRLLVRLPLLAVVCLHQSSFLHREVYL
jgi:hypothetical protein